MLFSSLPRAGSVLTAGVLAATLAGCGGKDPVGPEQIVSTIEISPKSALLYSVGQEVTFDSEVTTEAGTSGNGIEVAFVARDKSLLQVSSSGVAKALKKGGSTWVVVTAGGKSDSAFVEVPLTTCGSVTPTTMTAGQVVTDIGANGFCAAASEGSYTVIVHNNSVAANGTSTVEVTGIAVGNPASTGGASLARATSSATTSFGPALRQWRRDVAAEMRHRRNEERTIAPFVASARQWYESRKNRATRAAAPAVVGDLISVNVGISGGDGCSGTRTDVSARVAAVSNFAVVLADPRNPAGGFTDDEYNAFAQMFDSVIHPLDVAQFGAPSDIDGNQKVLLVFTKSINDFTSAGSTDFVSGLTHSRDLLPRSQCAGSNEAEMFYLLVPQEGHFLFNKQFVAQFTDVTIAHEYQHLINGGRRLYVLPATFPNVAPFEERWLNEGLSHMAEDMLFYRMSGRQPRSNFGGSDFNSTTLLNQWILYSFGNFFGYDGYATVPALTSPFEAGDDVTTRGATVAFLRYAADQTRSSDGTLWFDLVNKGDAGVTNLQNRLGVTSAGLLSMLRDFTISVYADDFVPGVAAKYTQPSWNMRSLYPVVMQLQPDATPPWIWPLQVTGLEDVEARTVSLQAGGFRVYRFTGLPGADSFIRLKGFGGAALPAGITASVIRTQ